MSTEYHQLPSQQGFLPVELLTDSDPWLIAATGQLSLNESWGHSTSPTSSTILVNNLNTSMGTPKFTNKPSRSPLYEHAGHNGSNNGGSTHHENSWKSVSTPIPENSNPLRVSAPYVTNNHHQERSALSSSSSLPIQKDQWGASPMMEFNKRRGNKMLSQSAGLPQSSSLSSSAPGSPMIGEDDDELTVQNRYKTELCKSYSETGACRYGTKCQFAHGKDEVRPMLRHPKYKTETCKTFHSTGTCPYGTRCRFIHTRSKDVTSFGVYDEEMLAKMNAQMNAPPGLGGSGQWSNSWSPASNLQKRQPANKKTGLGMVPLLEAMPDY